LNITEIINSIRSIGIEVDRLAAAAVILIIGFIASRIVRRFVGAVIDRSRAATDVLLRSFFVRFASALVMTLTVLTALGHAGVHVETFIAGLGITGIIIGFALRDMLANLAAGLLLLIYRPFKAGETIELEGSKGVVEELTIVNMRMLTSEGVRVIMPNAKVWAATITNHSMAQRRRLELTINVRTEHLDEAIPALRQALVADKRVLQEPAPDIRVTSVTDKDAALTIWVWTLPADFSAVGADGYLKLLAALKRAEIP
jgi:small conductance mechanosensitive channel